MTNKKKDAKFLDNLLSYLLARASHMVSEDFSPTLKENNVDRQHWRILASLSDYDKISIGKLARIVLMKQPTLTKILDKMEQENLVKRQHSTKDRRSIKIAITGEGRNKVSKLLVKAKKHEREFLQNYGDEKARVLKQLLRALIQRL